MNISRTDSCQCQLFLASVKILKKGLYHRPSSQILIFSRNHNVSFLFKLFFNYLIFVVSITILFTESFATTIHDKVSSNLSR